MIWLQKEREAFEAWYRKEYDNTVIDDSEFSEILDEYESNYYWVDELNQSWKAWQAAKAQTPVKLDKDTARQKLAMMWRGESTEINGRTVIFNESGCFDVRQDFGSGHFSQSLKATLDYLFQQRQSL